MKISKNLVKNVGFDRLLDGKKVGLFTLKNSDGMVLQITNYVGTKETYYSFCSYKFGTLR